MALIAAVPGMTVAVFLAVLLFALTVAAVKATAQVVGKAAAVNPDASAAGRTLTIGANVIHKERIRTTTAGSVQLLFIDRTTITIGPNSDLMIDEYVFDPNRGAAKMTVTLGKGLMRFVGGQISHEGEAKVNTPPATIGIRGGVAVISVNGKVTTATNVFGKITMTPTSGPAAGAPNAVPQGQTGTAASTAPVTTAPVSQQQLTNQNQQLQSKPGQTGGVSAATSSSAATVSNRPATPSVITPSATPAAGATAPGTSSARTSPSTNTSTNAVPSGVTSTNQSVQSSSSNSAAQASPPPNP